MLSSAVSELKGDKITRTLADQLLYYKDPTVSGFNILTAQNQLELVFAKKRYHGLLVGFFVWCFLYTGYWGLQYRDQLNYVPKTFSVTTYSVQVSGDGRNWSDVTCGAGVAWACAMVAFVAARAPLRVLRRCFGRVAAAGAVRCPGLVGGHCSPPAPPKRVTAPRQS